MLLLLLQPALTSRPPKSRRAMWPSLKPACSSDSSIRGMRLRLAMLQRQQQQGRYTRHTGVGSARCLSKHSRLVLLLQGCNKHAPATHHWGDAHKVV
jgi:hypothetical protein